MSTGKLTGMLMIEMMIAPVLVCGPNEMKTDSLFKALAVLKKNTGRLLCGNKNSFKL
jgi:hypothetical protein